MQTITVNGGVTKDLELKKSKNLNTYVMFSLAVNQGFGDNKTTNYYQCCLFDREAERIINANVKKGSRLLVSGKFSVEHYESNDGTDKVNLKIMVSDWEFAGLKTKDDNTSKETEVNESSGFNETEIDDDLPY